MVKLSPNLRSSWNITQVPILKPWIKLRTLKDFLKIFKELFSDVYFAGDLMFLSNQREIYLNKRGYNLIKAGHEYK